MGSALACDGVFDPQTGICHRSNGYEIPGQIKGGGGSKLIDYWGAIAIDVVNGKSSGIARDRRSKSSAESDAISACKNLRDCRVVISFKNSCGAVATNGAEVDASASDPDPAVAERKALAQCNKRSTKTCELWVKAKCAGASY